MGFKKALKKVVRVAPKIVRVADTPVAHTVGTAVGSVFGAPGAYDNALQTVQQGVQVAQKANVALDKADALYRNGVAMYQYVRGDSPAVTYEESIVMSESQPITQVRGEGASTVGVQVSAGASSARSGAAIGSSQQNQDFFTWLMSLIFGK